MGCKKTKKLETAKERLHESNGPKPCCCSLFVLGVALPLSLGPFFLKSRTELKCFLYYFCSDDV